MAFSTVFQSIVGQAHESFGWNLCQITDRVLIELSKTIVVNFGDMEEGLAHLIGHVEALGNHTDEIEEVVLHTRTLH